MAATSNVLSQSDIQGYLSRLKNTTPDPMTLLKQGGMAQFPQTQKSAQPAQPSQTATTGALNAVRGNVTGLGGNTTVPSGVNASALTLQPQAPKTSPGILSSIIPTAHAQTLSSGASGSWTPNSPVAPAAQASYQGGQAVPAVGTPEYAQAQNMAKTAAAAAAPASATPTTPPPSQPPQIPGAFSTFLGGLGAMGFGGSPQVNKAAQDLATFRQQYANTLADVQGDPNLSMDTKTGIGQILANRAATQESALSGLLSSALSGQGQQITALQGGAGLIPEALRYGSAGGGNLDPQTQATQLAQDVISGKRSYQDAINSLGYAGSAGQVFLNNAIRQANPNFNFNQAAVLAQQQGTVGPALNFATSALDNLDKSVQDLGFGQGTNIPGVNTIGDWVSTVTGLGSEKTRAYRQATAEARNAYAQVLAAQRGGTPTDYGDQARAAIPDDPTPNDIAAAKATLQSLGGAKYNIYGSPGTSSYGQGSSQSISEGNTTSAGGFNFVYKNGQWVAQ